MRGYVNVILQDRPVHYWALDEVAGTTAYDAMGISNGTHSVAALGQQPGMINREASGTPSYSATHYTEVSTAYILATLTNATVSLWVYPTTVNAEMPMYSERAASGADIWKVGTAPTSLSPNGLIEFTHRNTAGALSRIRSTVPLTANTRQHVAMAKAGTAILLYLNGVQVGNGTLSGNNTLTNANPKARIGGDVAASSAGWQGREGHVALFGATLTAGQIMAHYMSGLNGVPNPMRRMRAA